jgi:uncharacterized membrane protein YadS
MKAHAVLVKLHRIAAALFLLAIPFAAYASFTAEEGAEPSFLVYLPIFPMLFLTITGTYQLVRPWVLKARAKKAV